MKFHRGAKLFPEYRYIAGSMPGEGMTADQIVEAISEFGFFYTSAAPTQIPGSVGKAIFESSDGFLGPFALGSTQSISILPRDDSGFGALVGDDADPNFMFTINFMVENATSDDGVLVYPPYLKVTATPTGCFAVDVVAETFVWTVGQAALAVSGRVAPHKHFTIALCGATSGCGIGDPFGYDIKVETLVPWHLEGDYVWTMMPNGIFVVN